MGNDHVGVCARGKKFKKSERKKVAEEKNREASAVRVTKDNGWGPKHC